MRTAIFYVNGFEDLIDVEEYLTEAIEDLGIDSEFTGSLRITVAYLEDHYEGDNGTC